MTNYTYRSLTYCGTKSKKGDTTNYKWSPGKYMTYIHDKS